MVRSITFLESGFTEQFEKFVNPKTGKWRKIRFPSTVAVIDHETAGPILYDTGYSSRFFEQTKYFPEKIYSLITPVHIPDESTAKFQLNKMGLSENDIRHVIVSHFHADHIAGAGDFNRAQFIYSHHELNYFKNLSKVMQVKCGFIGGLLPSDFESRGVAADEFKFPLPDLGQGWVGKDLFGDESVFAVPLPGHTLGQIGLYIKNVNGMDYFLVADAAWITESYQKNILPMWIAQEVFFQKNEYKNTLSKIHETYCTHLKNGKLKIVTCHCDLQHV